MATAPPRLGAGAVPASLAELSYRAARASSGSVPLAVGATTLTVAASYPPTYLVNSYASFFAWARGSLELVRPQLLALAYPLLLLTAAELLLSENDDGGDGASPYYARELDAARMDAPVHDAVSAARHLLDTHRAEFGGAQARELAALSVVTAQWQLFGGAASPPDDGDAAPSSNTDVAASLLQLGDTPRRAAAGAGGGRAAAGAATTPRQRRAAKLAALLGGGGGGASGGGGGAWAKPHAAMTTAAAAAAQLGDPPSSSGGGGHAGGGRWVVDGDVLGRLLCDDSGGAGRRGGGSRYRVQLSPLALQLTLEYLTRSHSLSLLALLNERLAVVVADSSEPLAPAADGLPQPSALPYPGVDAVAGTLRCADRLLSSGGGGGPQGQGGGPQPPPSSHHLAHGGAGVASREVATAHALRWGVLPSSAHPGSTLAPSRSSPTSTQPPPQQYALLGRARLVPWPDYIGSPLGRALVCAAGEDEAAGDAARAAIAAALRVPDAVARGGAAAARPAAAAEDAAAAAAAPPAVGEKRARDEGGLAPPPPPPQQQQQQQPAEAPPPSEPQSTLVQLTALCINSSVSAPPPAAPLAGGAGGSGGSAAAPAPALRAAFVAPVTACAVHEFAVSRAGLFAAAHAATAGGRGGAPGGSSVPPASAAVAAAAAAAAAEAGVGLPPTGGLISDDPDGLVRVTAAGMADGSLRVYATVRLAVLADAPPPPLAQAAPPSSSAPSGGGAGAGATAAGATAAGAGGAPPQPPPLAYRTVDVPVVLTSSAESARASRCVHGVAIAPSCGRYVLTACLDGGARLFAIGPQLRSAVRAAVARLRATGVHVLPPPAHARAPASPAPPSHPHHFHTTPAAAAAAAAAGPSAAPTGAGGSGDSDGGGGLGGGGAAAGAVAGLLESLASESLHPLATYAHPAGSGSPLWAVAFNPLSAGVFAAGGRDGCARVWSSTAASQAAITCSGHVSDVTALAWHANGLYLLSGAADGAIRLHDAASGDCVRVLLRGHGAPVTALAPAPCGRWAASGDEDGVLTVWDVAPGVVVARGYATAAAAAAAAAAGRGGAGGGEAAARAGAVGAPLPLPPPPVYALAWEPRTSAVLAAGDGAGGVAVWALAGVVDRCVRGRAS
jgi:WD40 repeat protein